MKTHTKIFLLTVTFALTILIVDLLFDRFFTGYDDTWAFFNIQIPKHGLYISAIYLIVAAIFGAIVSVAIAKRKLAEKELKRTNHALLMIARCNQVLIHSTDETELMQKICRLIVELGEYRMAWVGIVEPGQNDHIRPVARFGFEEGYLDTLYIYWNDTNSDCGPTAKAIRTGTPQVVQHIDTDPLCEHCGTEARKRVYASSAAFPLRHDGQTIGALTVYSAEPEAFSEWEQILLKELSDDLAYGLNSLRIRTERRQALEESQTLKKRMDFILSATNTGIDIIDAEYNVRYVNEGRRKYHGDPAGRKCYDYFRNNQKVCEDCYVEKAFQTKKQTQVESVLEKENGRIAQINIIPFQDEKGEWLVAEVLLDITERKRIEQAIEESYQLMSAILNHTHILVAYLDPNFNYIWSNPAYAMAGRRDPSLLSGTNYFDLYPHEEKEPFFRRVVETGEPYFVSAKPYEHHNQPGRGKTFWDLSLIPIKDDSGAISGLVLTLIDVTSRIAMEMEIKKSEEKYRSLIANIPEITWTSDRNGHTHFISSNVEGIYGFTQEEIYQDGDNLWIGRIHRDDIGRVREAIESLFDGNQKFNIEYRIQRKDGQWIWGLDRSSSTYFKDGVQLADGVFSDITERKRTENALRESEHFNRTIISSVGEGVIVLDRQFRYQNWNRFMENLTGISKEALLGKHAFDVFPHLREQGIDVLFKQALSGKTVRSHDTHYYVPDTGKEGWVTGTYSPHLNVDGEIIGVVATVQDITERKLAEDRLKHEFDINASIAALSNQLISQTSSIEDIANLVLQEAKRLTGSRIGFVFSIAPDTGDAICQTMDSMIQANGAISENERFLVFPKNADGRYAGLLGYALNTRESFFTNSPDSYPAAYHATGDQPPISQFLSVPAVVSGERIGLIALANPGRDYTDGDIDKIKHLAALYALAVKRKQIEDALEISVRQWRETFDAIKDPVALLDAAGKILRCNYAMVQLLNKPYNETIDQSLLGLLHGIHKPIWGFDLDQLSTKRHVQKMALPLGNQWFQISIYPILKLSKLVGAVYVMNDISEIKKAEETVEKQREELQIIIDSVPATIWYKDLHNRFIRVNKAAAETVGLSVDDMVDKTAEELFPEESAAYFQDDLEVIKSEKPKLGIIEKLKTASGDKIWVQTDKVPYRDKDRNIIGIIVIATDITGRLRMEEALKAERTMLAQRVEERTLELSAVNAELIKANRLKDEFLANMSHELRTPLNTVLGMSEALQEQAYGPLNEKQLRSLHSIEESGRHLLSLINDILDVSKIEAGKLKLDVGPVSIRDVCESSLRLIKQDAHRKKIDVSFNQAPDIMIVEADPRRLKQILVNLLSNAIKFSFENGQIGLEVIGEPENEIVHFTVWDQGIGIAQEDIQLLFRPFVQLSSGLAREQMGTGLGLALVYRMTELHGGSISLVSEKNQGSRFTVSLPWRQKTYDDPEPSVVSQASGPESISEPGTHIPKEIPTILLAEDNEANIETISSYLNAHHCRTIVCRNGEETIERVLKERPDMILMDIQMPHIDGLETIRLIRQNPTIQSIPIAALTALAMPGDRERCLDAGANAYFSKPVRMKRLIAEIKKLTKL